MDVANSTFLAFVRAIDNFYYIIEFNVVSTAIAGLASWASLAWAAHSNVRALD